MEAIGPSDGGNRHFTRCDGAHKIRPMIRALALVGGLTACGPLDAVTIEVTSSDPIVMAHVDQVVLVADGGFRAAQAAPVELPVRFTIDEDEIDSALQSSGLVCLRASAMWHEAEVAHSAGTDVFANCIDFEDSPVQIALNAVPLDVLRHCAADTDCATDHCGPPSFSSSLTFCSAECASDDDCPTASRCTTKYDNAGTCIPECTADQECIPPGPFAFPTWRCDVDHDGLCGVQ
jgi:hypothetical protein